MADDSAPLVFDADDAPVTIYVAAPDGRIIDAIENVDLGDRRTAHERGRITLYEACQLAAIVTDRYRELTGDRDKQLVELPGRDRPTPAE